jgi:hypothetical protein
VNFVLKSDFEKASISRPASAEGDGEESRQQLIGVNTADGNGNVLLGVEIANRESRAASIAPS